MRRVWSGGFGRASEQLPENHLLSVPAWPRSERPVTQNCIRSLAICRSLVADDPSDTRWCFHTPGTVFRPSAPVLNATKPLLTLLTSLVFLTLSRYCPRAWRSGGRLCRRATGQGIARSTARQRRSWLRRLPFPEPLPCPFGRRSPCLKKRFLILC